MGAKFKLETTTDNRCSYSVYHNYKNRNIMYVCGVIMDTDSIQFMKTTEPSLSNICFKVDPLNTIYNLQKVNINYIKRKSLII